MQNHSNPVSVREGSFTLAQVGITDWSVVDEPVGLIDRWRHVSSLKLDSLASDGGLLVLAVCLNTTD